MRNRDERLATIAVVHAVFSDSARVIHACRSACAISPSAYRTMAKLSVRPRWAALGRAPRSTGEETVSRPPSTHFAAISRPFRDDLSAISRPFFDDRASNGVTPPPARPVDETRRASRPINECRAAVPRIAYRDGRAVDRRAAFADAAVRAATAPMTMRARRPNMPRQRDEGAQRRDRNAKSRRTPKSPDVFRRRT
ncbi:hypothetical protein [Burkholderia sp. ABCPW 111]|uniref:hypothetical protein n=1 Tax=Burkholderia sp. ABCPW 111 TaxID=1820025 RepID=UPI0012698BB6|nr:hypothetical protein [Burkholderia sp. ABCPW 111]